MNWECDNCGTVHASNPRKCSSCGNTVFSPSRAEVDVSDRPWLVYALVALLILCLLFGLTVGF